MGVLLFFYRLDVGRSDIIYERTRMAIDQLHLNPLDQEMHRAGRDGELILQGTCLRDVLLHGFSSQKSVHRPAPIQAADDEDYVVQDTLEHPSRMNADHGGAFKDDMRIQSWAKR